MAQNRADRRLAAILDVVAYSRLMEANEERTHALVKAHLDQVVHPTVANHKGRIVKSTGDGALIEFPSAVEAVQCAIAIQRYMAERNAGIPAEDQIIFRIGVNLGDIIVEAKDIYGSGVNVAARLEELADPGGILISGTVFDQVEGRIDHDITFTGEQQVKNIERPVRLYRVDWNSAASPVRRRKVRAVGHRKSLLIVGSAGIGICAAAITHVWFDSEPPNPVAVECKLPANPSIAVLPFKNSNNDPKQDHLVDGTTNDIITDLAKFSNLFVIAANSTFRYKDTAVLPQRVGEDLCVRYVLEGSFQKLDNTIRVNAQLIDAQTGYHVWADRYDRKYQDLLGVQTDITDNIVNIIGPISDAQGALLDTELDRVSKIPTNNLSAYDHYLTGQTYYKEHSAEANLLARKEFENAVALDPQYAKAVARIAWTHLQERWNGWGDDLEGALLMAEASALRAIKLRPDEADAHEALGAVRLFLRQHDLAIESLRRAVELNPNGADLLIHLGWAMTYADELDEAFYWMKEAIRRNPFHPGYTFGTLPGGIS